MIGGHNASVTRPTMLTLSEVATRDGTSGDAFVLPHIHDARLCAPCMAARFRTLNPGARRPAVAAEAVAAEIRRHDGNVWPAVIAFGISYRHACRIRAGWRPGGRRAFAIPYVSRGWISGARAGGAPWTESELRAAWGDR